MKATPQLTLKKTASTTTPLSWLFTATFADGTEIVQTPQDKPAVPRKDGGGSAMTDVTAYQEKSKLVAFRLDHTSTDEFVIVDLVNGNFVINGRAFSAHNQNFRPEAHDLELVFFREKLEQQNVTATVMSDGTIEYSNPTNVTSYVNRYFMGWKTIKKNKQVLQHTVAVD